MTNVVEFLKATDFNISISLHQDNSKLFGFNTKDYSVTCKFDAISYNIYTVDVLHHAESVWYSYRSPEADKPYDEYSVTKYFKISIEKIDLILEIVRDTMANESYVDVELDISEDVVENLNKLAQENNTTVSNIISSCMVDVINKESKDDLLK